MSQSKPKQFQMSRGGSQDGEPQHHHQSTPLMVTMLKQTLQRALANSPPQKLKSVTQIKQV